MYQSMNTHNSFMLQTLRRLSNLETTIIVRLKEESISRMASNHKEEHHSTLLCWRNKSIRCGGEANDFTMERISSGVLSGSPFFAYKRNKQTSWETNSHLACRVSKHTHTHTLRTNPGVSIIVRLGQWAYSALSTIGLGETAVLVFFKSASVRDFIISAMVDAETTGLPYSSESSSYICFQHSIFRY